MAREKQCSGGCGTLIHFDERDKALSGKWRPLESNGEKHTCPGPQTEQQQQPQQQPQPQPQQQTAMIPGMAQPKVIQLPEKDFIHIKEQLVGINMQLSKLAEGYAVIVKTLAPRYGDDSEKNPYGASDEEF